MRRLHVLGSHSLAHTFDSLHHRIHAELNELASHVHLGTQRIRAVLHPRRTRALLHRRVYRLLHLVASLPLLPLARQQQGLVPGRPQTRQDMVPALLLLREQHSCHRAQRVRVAAKFHLSRLSICEKQVEEGYKRRQQWLQIKEQ